MGRKSKYSAEEKLLILNEVLRNGIHKVITKYKISQKTIRRWSLLYK
ncbi:transposase, partial [Weissella confusa]|nr:transposase [Weissella confusa]MCW3763750.1 transposase [Weissella confusa]